MHATCMKQAWKVTPVGVQTRILAVTGVVALLPLVTACNDDKPAALAPSPSIVPSSAASPSTGASAQVAPARVAANEEAVKAYRGMVDAWVEAAKTSNAGYPALRQYTSGQALKILADALFSAKMRKLIAKGAPVISPTAVDARPVDAPTDVVVQDCFDTTNWLLYKKASGELADNIPGDRRQFKAVVRKKDGAWKVDGIVTTGSC